ncbi:copper amine oxidase N-terminal domain-containing protein [Cohnella rhizosphaerae]|uniref:Copper amine oxidase N-terminal domain-containing protein n=1 Tax=Cohnella rhizosphaerae TaxID=1457232 RepID=A0A9X4KXZ5_9BACL|nr:copper amine oxidase N-terminal domain-containing protein [Cohnella rhizosphaerae]MDG0810399.1 copper amine oxidase N-terminal domain-containing protein [Cohnella rhizosphaerae]
MKKNPFILLCVLTAMLFALTPLPAAHADSPVTSTDFYKAYTDEPIVQKALQAGGMTAELATYLADESSPLALRAAVINALGWETEPTQRAEAYAKQAYGKSLAALKQSELRGDERFVIGYLLAMDDYLDTRVAEQWLEGARQLLPDSFTAALIHAIVKAQEEMKDAGWPQVWKTVADVAFDPGLKMDMRPKAAEIIIDYMVTYSDKRVINPFAEQSRLTLRIGDRDFKLNGETFEIDPGYGTAPALIDGSAYLPVRFLTEAVGGDIRWEAATRTVRVDTAHVSMKLTIGEKTAVVNGEEKQLLGAPYISNGRTMLPFRFLGEALGFDVSWDAATRGIGLTLDSQSHK